MSDYGSLERGPEIIGTGRGDESSAALTSDFKARFGMPIDHEALHRGGNEISERLEDEMVTTLEDYFGGADS